MANTYSMITFERTREIGTPRALGMHSSGVVAVFVAEALVLSIVGLVAVLTVGAGVVGSLRASVRAGRIPPVDALRQ